MHSNRILTLGTRIAFCLLAFWALALPTTAQASAPTEGEGEPHFNVRELLFHHILDSHEWHLLDIPAGVDENGKAKYIPIGLHLPYILYSSEKGLDIFTVHGHGDPGHDPMLDHGYITEGHSLKTQAGATVIDMSITKTVLQMMIVALLVILVFGSVAAGYRKRQGQAPKGIQSLFEPLIIFIRDEVVRPNLGAATDRFTPYMLTLFFFIWFSNLLGLTPFNSNIMGNISVTAALAVLTMIITNVNGSKDYWGHIFWFPGVPTPVRLIILPVELIGIFTKPFALTVRLFANISGGHFMILSLVSLMFILNDMGRNPAGGWAIMPLSVAFTFGIMILEVLVAVIQAYVFTLLTCVFLGAAMESHDHHDDHSHDHAHAHAHAQ